MRGWLTDLLETEMAIKDIVGVATALVVVAGIMVMVVHGAGTASVLGAASHGFANDIQAATGQSLG